MAVDIFEELVRAHLQGLGYFTLENVRYGLPENSKTDPPYRTDPSDIDLIAFAPRKRKRRVLAISCKGASAPFDPKAAIAAIEGDGKLYGREAWRSFRELAHDDWATAFRNRVRQVTGEDAFHHVTFVGHLTGPASQWSNHAEFRRRMGGQPLLIYGADKVLETLILRRETLHGASSTARIMVLISANEQARPAQGHMP